MGLYDEPGLKLPLKLIYLAILLLLVLDILLLLPPFFEVGVDLSKSPVNPGEEAILWIRVNNNGASPLTGGFLVVSPQSPFLEVNKRIILPDVPSRGEVVEQATVYVRPGAPSGDHLVRIFVSFPGETKVKEFKVRVG